LIAVDQAAGAWKLPHRVISRQSTPSAIRLTALFLALFASHSDLVPYRAIDTRAEAVRLPSPRVKKGLSRPF
jgi:hypothetical protein